MALLVIHDNDGTVVTSYGLRHSLVALLSPVVDHGIAGTVAVTCDFCHSLPLLLAVDTGTVVITGVIGFYFRQWLALQAVVRGF